MKALFLRYVLVLAAVALSGWVLLYTSQSVQKSRAELAGVEREIAREKTRIGVLEGEWSYLNSPERLDVLARKYLGLVPPSARDNVMVEGVSAIPRPPEVVTSPLQPAVFEAPVQDQGGPQDAE